MIPAIMLDVSIKDQTTHDKGQHVRCVYKKTKQHMVRAIMLDVSIKDQTTHDKGHHVRCVYTRSNNTW